MGHRPRTQGECHGKMKAEGQGTPKTASGPPDPGSEVRSSSPSQPLGTNPDLDFQPPEQRSSAFLLRSHLVSSARSQQTTTTKFSLSESRPSRLTPSFSLPLTGKKKSKSQAMLLVVCGPAHCSILVLTTELMQRFSGENLSLGQGL